MIRFSVAQILAAVLLALAIGMALRLRDNRRLWPFVVMASAAALQAIFVSLRWEFGFTLIRLPQIMLTCLLPPMAWLSFRTFTKAEAQLLRSRDTLLLVPLILVLASYVAFPDFIDPIIISSTLGFGLAFLRLALQGENALEHAALQGLANLRAGLWFVIFALLGSAVVDILVFADFWYTRGTHAPALINLGNLAFLLALLAVVVLSAGAVPEPAMGTDTEADGPDANPGISEEDLALDQRLQHLLVHDGLIKDSNLSLNRMARRLGVPARSVSRAINRVHNCNVSQYVNGLRVAEACRLLQATDLTVTAVIYESGFQTKSNFNREFRRVTGTTPRNWKSSKGFTA